MILLVNTMQSSSAGVLHEIKGRTTEKIKLQLTNFLGKKEPTKGEKALVFEATFSTNRISLFPQLKDIYYSFQQLHQSTDQAIPKNVPLSF